jgi:soluble lytic murein transglycosylase-like protein
VGCRTPIRHARVTAAAAIALAVVLPGIGAGPTAFAQTARTAGLTASAALPGDGVSTADAKVQALLAKVRRVSREVAAAEQRYTDALNAVASGVNQAITADRDNGAVRSLLTSSRDKLDQQVLGLYASGGDLATAASMLSPSGLVDYDEGAHAMSAAVAQTVVTAKEQAAAAQAAGHRAAASSRRADHSIATARTVAKAADRVTRLLGEQRNLLAQARRELATQRQLAAARAAAAAAAAARAAYTTDAAAFASATTSGVSAVGVLPPSAEYLRLYQHAATTCPGMPWTVLAAIGQVESGHGRNDGPSSAGAMGPMQFEPATFASYAVDGDHDGKTDIMDPADAIYTAAHYLCANGAGRGQAALASAILHYNHAEWYVQLVLGLAAKYSAAYS